MRHFILIALGISLLLATLASPFASSHPDGLERVAEDHHFEKRATEVWRKAPMPDYAAPIPSLDARPGVQTALAGGFGTLLVFALLAGSGRLIGQRLKPSVNEQGAS